MWFRAIVLCMAPWLWTGCSGALAGPWFRGVLDADGDGWALSAGDCDDTDPEISPSAIDWPDDAIDSDCDGADAETLPIADSEPGMLVITEVMPQPVGVDDALGEWFEIDNRSDYDIEFEGLGVYDNDNDDFVVLTPLVAKSGKQIVFGAWGDPEQNGGVTVDYVYGSSFGLSNSTDAIRLSIDGRIIDEVIWDARYPLEEGYSLSLDPSADADENDTPDRWCLAEEDAIYGIGGRGSPGEGNPDCPAPFEGLLLSDLEEGDLVITEIMTAPLAVDDDFGEWFEIANTLSEDIDLIGMTVSDDAGDSFDIERSLVIPGHGRVVIGAFLDEALNGGVEVDAEWRWEFRLANSGDTVRLSYGTLEIDAVSYDNGNTFPDPEGASMSLGEAALAEDGAALNDDGANWCVSTTPYGQGDLGTPGAPNPPCD